MAELDIGRLLIYCDQPDVSSAIIGASRPEQILKNIKAREITLSEDMLHHIDEIIDGIASYDH